MKYDHPADMQRIPYPTQQAPSGQPGAGVGQPAAHPNQQVMGQCLQQYHHLLGFKALLVPSPAPQAVLVLFDLNLHPTAALIVEAHIGPQDGLRVTAFSGDSPTRDNTSSGARVERITPTPPLPVLLPTPDGNPAHRTDVYPVGRESDPPKLAVGVLWVGEPLLDTGGQLFRPMPGVILANACCEFSSSPGRKRPGSQNQGRSSAPLGGEDSAPWCQGALQRPFSSEPGRLRSRPGKIARRGALMGNPPPWARGAGRRPALTPPPAAQPPGVG